MKIWIPSGRMTLVLLGCLCLMTACNTTPSKPPPPPKPHSAEPPPPPPPSSAREQQKTQAGAAATATYAPPSANAAEVEIEETPVDGSPAPAASESQARAGATSGGSRSGPAGGSDNRPPPASGEAPVMSAGGNIAQSGLVGPEVQLSAQTDDERLAALDAQLTGQLNDFDERMRRARAAAEADRAAGGGSTAGVSSGRGSRVTDPNNNRGAGGAATSGTGIGNTPDLSGTTTAAGQVAKYAPPAGIADGKDDDIVARQLREAASSESDPVLREKLWDEYRNYKAGL